jgi:hypothetical protein
MFIHHPNGLISVGGYQITLAFFEKMEPGYVLPEGASGQVYEPLRRHIIIYRETELPISQEWPEGDGYIAKAQRYARVYRKQQESRPGILERKVRRIWQ